MRLPNIERLPKIRPGFTSWEEYRISHLHTKDQLLRLLYIDNKFQHFLSKKIKKVIFFERFG